MLLKAVVGHAMGLVFTGSAVNQKHCDLFPVVLGSITNPSEVLYTSGFCFNSRNSCTAAITADLYLSTLGPNERNSCPEPRADRPPDVHKHGSQYVGRVNHVLRSMRSTRGSILIIPFRIRSTSFADSYLGLLTCEINPQGQNREREVLSAERPLQRCPRIWPLKSCHGNHPNDLQFPVQSYLDRFHLEEL